MNNEVNNLENLDDRRLKIEQMVNEYIDSLTKYYNINDAKTELENLANSGKYNYEIFKNIRECYYIVVNSKYWEALSRNDDYEIVEDY